MARIPIRSIPGEPGTPAVDSLLVMDDGVKMSRTTTQAVVDAVAPVASQGEAEAGVDNTKRMTSLRVKQSIAVETAPITSDLNAHIADTENPHSVTKDQVGLGNVDNTSDANKPISSATQSALDEKLNLDGSNAMTGPLTMAELSDPEAPLAGHRMIYPTDSGWKTKNSAGVETDLGSAYDYPTKAAAEAASIPAVILFFRTGGYAAAGDGGGGLYSRAISEPDHAGKIATNGGTVWWELSEGWVCPEMFGATGDGETDDAEAFQAAITFAGEKGASIALMNARRYLLPSALEMPSGLIFKFNGAVLDFSTISSGSPVDCLYAEGDAGAAISVMSDVALGATVISVSDASSIAEGDVLRLWSEDAFDPGVTDSWRGELVFVEGVAGNDVTLRGPTMDAYAVADNAQIERISPVSGIRLIGPGRILGNPADENNDRAVSFYRATDCKVIDVQLENFDLAHVRFRDSYNCHALEGRYARARPTVQGYAVSFQDATQDCSAVGNFFLLCKNSLATNNSANYGGVPRRITFERNIVRDSRPPLGGGGTGAAISTHSASEDIWIRKNDVINAGGGSAILLVGAGGEIVGNHIRGAAQHGISVSNSSGKASRVKISRNIVEGATQIGISVSVSASGGGFRRLSVTDNEVERCGGYSYSIVGPSGSAVQNVEFSGNYSDGSTGALGAVILQRINGLSCLGNEVNAPSGAADGIRLVDVKKVSLAGNIVNHDGGLTTANGINVTASSAGSSADLEFSGNFIDMRGGASNRYGISLSNNVQNARVRETNRVLGATTDILLGSGAGNINEQKRYFSVTADPPSVDAGATATFNLTATGAAVGDMVIALSCSVDLGGLVVAGRVDAANQIKVVIYNPTGAAVDIGSSTWRAVVQKAA